jgi:hypothetical protein
VDSSILAAVIGVVSGTVSAAVSTYFAFRLRFEKFEAMMEERETQVIRWREAVDVRLSDLQGWRQQFIGEHSALMQFRDEWRATQVERTSMHLENTKKLDKLSDRLSHIEGALSGRWPKPKGPGND